VQIKFNVVWDHAIPNDIEFKVQFYVKMAWWWSNDRNVSPII